MYPENKLSFYFLFVANLIPKFPAYNFNKLVQRASKCAPF